MNKSFSQLGVISMVRIRHFFLIVFLFILGAILCMNKHSDQPSVVLLCALQISYIIFFGGLIVILRNRRKLLADRRFSAVEISMSILLLNLFSTTSMIWCIQLFEGHKAFDNLTSILDAMYFSVITFLTVGYGDIKPITPLAKTICMEAAISNLLILVVFMNYFMAKASIKKNYKMDCVLNIVFMFEHMSNRIQIADNSLEGLQKTWPEWGNELIRILRENLEENPEGVEKLKQRIDDAKDQNSKKTLRAHAVDLTGVYINDTEHFLLEGLYSDMREAVIPSIREVLRNRVFLIENENISEDECLILQMFEESFSSIVTAVSYSENRSLNVLEAVMKDLQEDLSKLGYQIVNELPYGKSGEYVLSKAVINEHRHISILEDFKSFAKTKKKKS